MQELNILEGSFKLMEDEDKTYTPEEIIFHVMPGNADFDTDTVVFTTKKCWEENGYQSDDLGGHNMPVDELDACGICDCEMMESVFEIKEGFDPAQVRKDLLAAGFIENADFSKYIEEETR